MKFKKVVKICDLCNHSPCLMGCPNHTAKPTLRCDECGRYLYLHDKFITFDGETVGSECYGRWDTNDWLDFLHLQEKEI